MTITNLSEAIEQLDAMRAELGPAIDAMNTLEKAIKQHVLETGETHERITIRNGYERTSWDTKSLKGYAAAHPEILQFEKVSMVGPSVVISKV